MTIAIGIVCIVFGTIFLTYLINKKGSCPQKWFDLSTLIWSSILYTKKNAILSFITLVSGVFILFTVGLNRQGFTDATQIRSATGGFSLWCETSVPIYHDLLTQEGRTKLALNDLHKDAKVMQLLKYSADDASCLNLNKVITPNVLGVDMDELATRFGCTKIVSDPSAVYPALIDQTVLTWSLGKKLGDVIFYPGEKGDTIAIQLSGTIQNSIFQGYILIDKGFFSEIWSEISGSEILLVTVPDKEVANTKILLSQALNNYGIRVMTTGERLKMFYSVINTYLTIFLTLGGLGLLIGIFSFIIVVRKNIVARTTEVILYHSLGFDQKRIINLLYKENIIVPLAALFTGAFGSFIGVSFGLGNVGITIWILATLFLVLFFLCVLLFVKHSVNHSVNHFVNLSVNRFVDYSANRFVDHSENHS